MCWGSAAKAQPPLFGDGASLIAIKLPARSEALVGFPVILVSPKEFPSKLGRCQSIDKVLVGVGPPVMLFRHPLTYTYALRLWAMQGLRSQVAFVLGTTKVA